MLDILNQERAAAEKKNMIYRTEQRVAQLREEALMTQVPRTDPGFYFPFREHTGQCGCFWDYFKKRVMNRNLNGILLS